MRTDKEKRQLWENSIFYILFMQNIVHNNL